LGVEKPEQKTFLFRNYKLDYQNFCVDVFGEEKNIDIIDKNSIRENNDLKKEILILFKNEEEIEEFLINKKKEISWKRT
jgi:hypothetical protein